jgi:hypothetical protein
LLGTKGYVVVVVERKKKTLTTYKKATRAEAYHCPGPKTRSMTSYSLEKQLEN